LYIDTLFS